MPAVSWVAVIVASLAGFLLGALWYGPLFGKAWMREVGYTEEDLKRDFNPGKAYGLTFVYGLIAAYVMGAFLGPNPDLGAAAALGTAAGLGWVGTSFATNYQFERKSNRLLYINAGYHTFQFMLFGVVFGLLG